jgi:hypothetical protein
MTAGDSNATPTPRAMSMRVEDRIGGAHTRKCLAAVVVHVPPVKV